MRCSNIILMEVQPQRAGRAAAAEILHPVINPVTYWIIPQNAKTKLSERYGTLRVHKRFRTNVATENSETFSNVIINRLLYVKTFDGIQLVNTTTRKIRPNPIILTFIPANIVSCKHFIY